MVWEILGDAGEALVDSTSRVEGEAVAVAAILLLAWLAPDFGRRRLVQWERAFARFAAHRRLAMLAAGALPVLMRLALLPVVPIPQPYMPDEFGHLLLADTFASGRLTNPTHPMWRYFETLYVFHQPTYTSLYPAAQGLFLAGPMALGASPWFGVCLSMGLMCAALAWMLQGWLPPKWALLGALLTGLRLSFSTYWMNSYWGGAVSALGGALLAGALPRLLRRPRVRDAVIGGVGVAILSQSRPFEGALLSGAVGGMALYGLARDRQIRVMAVLLAAGLAIGAGTMYYNWRVTGDPWLWPYQWHQRIYGTPQNLRGTAPILTAARLPSPDDGTQKDILQNFEWQLGLFQAQATAKGLAAALPEKADVFWDFYLQPILSLPLLFLPFVWRRRQVRFALPAVALVLTAGFVLYPFFFPHYAAPVYGLLLVLVLEGARQMRVARAGLFRWWLIGAAASCVSLAVGSALAPDLVVRAETPRSRIEQQLESRGGKHLVLVRYTATHNYHHPWIYNSANIDQAPVVWAREMGGEEPSEEQMAPLLEYFRGRSVWSVTVGDDDDQPELRLLRNPGPQY